MMALAFWRRKDSKAETARKRRSGAVSADQEAGALESATTVRVRARRRLIGAAALLLIVAIVVPMLLDPEPRPLTDDIAIDIPSERTPFTPRLSLPPVPAPDNVPVAPPPDVAPVPEPADELPMKPVDTKPAVDSKKLDEQRARALLESKANSKPAATSEKGTRFAVQAAAPASETAARNLAERLKKIGLAPYTEKVETKQGARYRVRLGPYASRDEADDVRTRLKAQGISANLITL